MRFDNVKGRGQTDRERGSNRHRCIVVAIRLVVTAALISYVLRVAHVNEIRRVFLAAHWSWLVLAIVVFVGAQILCALRWALVSSPLQLNRSWQKFLPLYFL